MTVKVNCGPPGAAVAGLNEDRTGAGVAETLKGWMFDVTFPGLFTVMLAEPAVAMRVAGTAAVSWAALT